jgi:hypothetical protein
VGVRPNGAESAATARPGSRAGGRRAASRDDRGVLRT